MVRKTEEQEPHDKAVAEIAIKRFSFPNKGHPNWKTFTNPNGEHNKGIKKNQESVYPDIVVVDMEKNVAKMIGEVETASTVNEEEYDQWNEYSSLCRNFYLYVPKNHGYDAKSILDSKSIKYSGLRTYEFDSQDKISIINV